MLPTYDLRLMAHRAMLEAGFQPDIPPDASREAILAIENQDSVLEGFPVRDLRDLLWSSLDAPGTMDLDQVEFVEECKGGSLRLMVGIADVNSYLRRGSASDLHAFTNTTSVYTAVEVFPMLPEELSTDLTSLLQSEERLGIVVDMEIGLDGQVNSQDIYQALVYNHAQLDYDTVGAWLDGRTSTPETVLQAAGLEKQLQLQVEAARRLSGLRERLGALEFQTIEAIPIIYQDKVVAIQALQHNPAREIIEAFMIAANTAIAGYLKASGTMSLRRVVRTPRRWERIVEIAAGLDEKLPDLPDALALSAFLERRRVADPEHFPDLSLAIIKLIGPGEYVVNRQGLEAEGHFGLAVHDYTHSTAPNRRYADLVTQRLVEAVLAGNPPPYTGAELEEIAEHCNERESAAKKVERRMEKAAAALLLSSRIGEVFPAIVTGASPKGTWARLIDPPVEGRVVYNEQGLDVGDHISVRLLSVDPEQGFIDFEAVRE